MLKYNVASSFLWLQEIDTAEGNGERGDLIHRASVSNLSFSAGLLCDEILDQWMRKIIITRTFLKCIIRLLFLRNLNRRTHKGINPCIVWVFIIYNISCIATRDAKLIDNMQQRLLTLSLNATKTVAVHTMALSGFNIDTVCGQDVANDYLCKQTRYAVANRLMFQLQLRSNWRWIKTTVCWMVAVFHLQLRLSWRRINNTEC